MSGIAEDRPGSVFPGAIGRTVEESSPAWPAPTRARDGAPNVLFLVLDDVFELEGLSCGYDYGAPAGDGYEPPFALNSTIHRVMFDLSGELKATTRPPWLA